MYYFGTLLYMINLLYMIVTHYQNKALYNKVLQVQILTDFQISRIHTGTIKLTI